MVMMMMMTTMMVVYIQETPVSSRALPEGKSHPSDTTAAYAQKSDTNEKSRAVGFHHTSNETASPAKSGKRASLLLVAAELPVSGIV